MLPGPRPGGGLRGSQRGNAGSSYPSPVAAALSLSASSLFARAAAVSGLTFGGSLDGVVEDPGRGFCEPLEDALDSTEGAARRVVTEC